MRRHEIVYNDHVYDRMAYYSDSEWSVRGDFLFLKHLQRED